MREVRIEVCICTHNPRPEILELTLKSLAAQDADPRQFSLLIVDNASTPPLEPSLLKPLEGSGIKARMVSEPTPGLSRARLKAIAETTCDWVLFLDDDNELYPDYLSTGLNVIDTVPELGCFGGKLILPEYIKPSRLYRPFLPYLAIKDCGDEVMTDRTDYWGPWEPPGAGSYVHRRLLEHYRDRAAKDEQFFALGRTGKKSVASCEDSLMMRGAVELGLYCSYQPGLKIIHHISPHRLDLRYLMKLMYGFGVSIATCELLLNSKKETPEEYRSLGALINLCKRTWKSHLGDPAYAIGVMIMYYGQYKIWQNR